MWFFTFNIPFGCLKLESAPNWPKYSIINRTVQYYKPLSVKRLGQTFSKRQLICPRKQIWRKNCGRFWAEGNEEECHIWTKPSSQANPPTSNSNTLSFLKYFSGHPVPETRQNQWVYVPLTTELAWPFVLCCFLVLLICEVLSSLDIYDSMFLSACLCVLGFGIGWEIWGLIFMVGVGFW